MDDWRAALLADMEALAEDFKSLFATDCKCVARVERAYWPSRYDKPRRLFNPPEMDERWDMSRSGCGLEVEPRSVTTAEDAQAATVFYDASGRPVVNSVGESLIVAPGWRESNQICLAGAGSRRASETIHRADRLVSKYAGPILSAVLPDKRRGQLFGGGLVWPSIVNLVADAANRSVLARTEWLVAAGNQSYSLAVWRRRNEFTLVRPMIDPKIVEAIGDEPENVYSDRRAFLGDSKLALNWLIEQLRAAMASTAANVESSDPCDGRLPDGLSPDGRVLRWGGIDFPIKPGAIGVIRLLVKAYSSGQPYLSQAYLMAEGECETEMRTLVKNNRLHDVMIRQKGPGGKTVKGMWGLVNPAEIKKKTTTH